MGIVWAGVDWLTMTTNRDSVGMSWFRIYDKYKKQKLAEVNKEQPFNNGYYAGLGIAAMRWGYNKKIGYILIISGGEAELLWQKVQPALHKVTRLDLCVDFVLNEADDLAQQHYTRLVEQPLASRRKYALFENSKGGSTLYIGSRQSQQFGRFYDKGIEGNTHEKGRKWRAEVEYKKPLAGAVATALADKTPEKRQGAIIATVGQWYADRNAGLSVVPTGGEALEIQVEQRITTAEKKLAWLRGQVGPTVVDLVEAGFGRSVLKSLMLDEERLKGIELSKN